jgi:hypothetical protein
MARDRICQPRGAVFVVDAVPEPPGTGNLVLPLLHRRAVDGPAPKAASKRMLPGVALAWIARDPLPRRSGVRRRHSAQLRPSGYRAARRVSEVPPSGSRRRRDALPSLRHALRGGWPDSGAIGISHSAKAPGQRRVCVDLGGRPPLTHELAHWPIRVELGRSGGHAGKLLDECAPIRTRQKLEPRKGVARGRQCGGRGTHVATDRVGPIDEIAHRGCRCRGRWSAGHRHVAIMRAATSRENGPTVPNFPGMFMSRVRASLPLSVRPGASAI